MRERRCHTKHCGGTFESPDGRRKFCDKCRKAKHALLKRKEEARRRLDPQWRRKKAEYWKNYRNGHLEAMRAYGRDWMRNWRKGLPTKKTTPSVAILKPKAKPQAKSGCYQCGLRLLPKDEQCPRCGFK